MHRTHNGGSELQKGQRLLSAVVQFTQNCIVNILCVEDAEKFPLYIQFTQYLMHITKRLSVVWIDWASLRNLSMLLAQYMWDVAIPPTHCFTADTMVGSFSSVQSVTGNNRYYTPTGSSCSWPKFSYIYMQHTRMCSWIVGDSAKVKLEFTVTWLSYSHWSEPQCHVVRNTITFLQLCLYVYMNCPQSNTLFWINC